MHAVDWCCRKSGVSSVDDTQQSQSLELRVAELEQRLLQVRRLVLLVLTSTVLFAIRALTLFLSIRKVIRPVKVLLQQSPNAFRGRPVGYLA